MVKTAPIRQYELVERVMSYDKGADEELLNRAYVYAMKAHGGQKRASGEAYFNHPLEVAAILAEMKLDGATIAAALLHDVVEDTEATQSQIEERFGHEIASLVDGLTKIKRLDLVTKEATQAENLRKLLLAMAKDVRVLLVKLADRLHNMRTLGHMAPDKKIRISQETMDIYAPLAGRMGMQNVREELEDISFRVLNPDAFATVKKRLDRLHEESGSLLLEIEKDLKGELKANGIDAKVTGREKRPYSIWRKMERKSLSLGQLSDIFGFRVIVSTSDECYRALGVAHRTWRAVPGRFKDYISTPKQNDYQSLHTTVIGPHHRRVEMQIRTRDMNEIAERGVAAHALYKDVKRPQDAINGVRVPSAESNAYRWLRHLVEMLSEGESPREFLEHTRLELFQDQVFCFTPKGQLIALPRGATPIDFAYAVHTSIGDSCVGCRINGRHAPLVTQLDNGDEVEIIRSEAQVPPAAWEGLAVTGKARAAIRRATRLATRRQYAGLGKEIVERLLEKVGKSFIKEDVASAISRTGHKNLEDALSAVGRGELAAADILKAMGLVVEGPTPQRRKPATRHGEAESGIPIRGAGRDQALKFSLATGAVPGERIVGIRMPGGGIVIYPIFARALESFDSEPTRWIDLTWDSTTDGQRFPARILVKVHNEIGALAQVSQVIGDSGANIDELQMVTQEGARDFFDLDILIEVNDLKHLNQIMRDLELKPLVSSVDRAEG
jgi:GTP diphosphokinase / guanosine-3',5'-bis(diphosphate) 3'-diphosphatase